MSQETMHVLNTRQLVGMTAKRGNAWHYRLEEQGTESNHYPDAIPVADVHRRLFNWTPAIGDVTSQYLTDTGVGTVVDPTRKSIIRPAGAFGPDDMGEILGLFKLGYQVHAYGEWLVDAVSLILDSGLRISSAGVLKSGALAYVQCELAESVQTAGGVVRPFITAATSLDGSLSTTYGVGAIRTVCDNTLGMALRADQSAGTQHKVRHSKGSLDKLTDVRAALGIFVNLADDYSESIAVQCETEVTDRQWAAFLAAHAPITKDAGKITTTLAEKRRDELSTLWNNDARVAPWKGTVFGVVQAVNTHAHHVQTVRGMERAERNQLRMVEGEWSKIDGETIATLTKVLATV